MSKTAWCLATLLLVAMLAGPAPADDEDVMDLGKFSISLTVKDMAVSKAFYEKLGFEMVPDLGEQSTNPDAIYDENWVILQRGGVTIGLFEGLFDKNILTFNPPDVRAVQQTLKERGVVFVSEANESTTGPAAAVLVDPDGNPILLDQHND